MSTYPEEVQSLARTARCEASSFIRYSGLVTNACTASRVTSSQAQPSKEHSQIAVFTYFSRRFLRNNNRTCLEDITDTQQELLILPIAQPINLTTISLQAPNVNCTMTEEELTSPPPLPSSPSMTEISSQEMLINLMSDQELLDSALEGDDGVRIQVNRYALAARSPVFRRMLFGKFVEANHPVVKIGFHSHVLKAVVEYIHKDTADILDEDAAAAATTTEFMHSEQVQTIVSTMAAGMYFQLPGLSEKAHQFLSNLLESNPSLAFAVLEGCKQAGPSVPEELEALALAKIRCLVGTDFKTAEIAMLSPCLMEEILKDPEMGAYEYELFKLLLQWAEASDDDVSKRTGSDPPLHPSIVGRREIACQLTEYIHLEHIDPRSLSTVVANSGLVTSEQLMEAFKLQALAAQDVHNIAFNKHRKMPIWESISDSFRQCLKVSPIKTGIHRWTLEIEEHGRYLWVGVVQQGTAALYAFSSWVDGVRLYINESYGNPHNNLGMLKLATGSRVTFVIDMTPGSGNGTLCASVDGGPMLRLFSHLLDRLDDSDESGFVPAMCLKSPASVRLLSIEKV
jgi:BTB/POZ domain